MVTENSKSLSADWSCDHCNERIPGRIAMEFDNSLAIGQVNHYQLQFKYWPLGGHFQFF